jgi:hypothetical protein
VPVTRRAVIGGAAGVFMAVILAGGGVSVVAAVSASASMSATPAAADPGPEPQQDPATSRAQARSILARPEFRVPQPSLFDRARTWLAEALGRLITSLFTGGIGSALAWTILAVVVALMIFVATRVLRTVQHEPTRPGPARAAAARRSPIEWRQEAEACEARGDWKNALRAHFRALIGDLLARGMVRDLPGRTSGEYRTDVAVNLPVAAEDFAAATELFERAWYGDVPTGPDECARFRRLADQVIERAGRPARGADLDRDPVTA